jgi:hypothetical protein
MQREMRCEGGCGPASTCRNKLLPQAVPAALISSLNPPPPAPSARPHLCLADWVEEDGRWPAQDDVPVVGVGQRAVLQGR